MPKKRWQERDGASSAFSITSLLELDMSFRSYKSHRDKDKKSVVTRDYASVITRDYDTLVSRDYDDDTLVTRDYDDDTLVTKDYETRTCSDSTIRKKKDDNVRRETISILEEELRSRDEKSLMKKRKKKKKRPRHMEMDETMVTHYSLRDVVQKGPTPNRVIGMASLFIILCSSSFILSSLLLDTLQLTSIDETSAILQPSNESMSESTIENLFSDRFLEIKSKLMKISDPKAFEKKDSPQTKALDWIANHDKQKLKVEAPNLLQRYALAVLFYSTGGESWKQRFSWLSDKHECHWKGEGGIRDCTDKWEVKDVALMNNLQGTIPSEFFQLTKLEVLYLARNSLEGSIPTEIGLLTNLKFAGLAHNRLTGTVPTLHMGNLLKLSSFHIERNTLSGTIKKVDPLCQLRTNLKHGKGAKKMPGSLQRISADCKVLVKWKKPAVTCGCCTKCVL